MSAQIQTPTNGHTPTAPASFSEAPASINTLAVSPAGFSYQLTMRGSRVGDLLQQARTLEAWLTENGWTPASKATGKSQALAQGDAPTCPEHGKAMQRGKYGWFCPVKVGEHPQTGKALYCQHSVKAGQP